MRGRRAYNRDRAVGSKTNEGQEDEAEPSKRRVDQWNLQSVPLDALVLDEPVLPHAFNTLDEELGSGSHEADGDDDGTETNPGVGLGVLER